MNVIKSITEAITAQDLNELYSLLDTIPCLMILQDMKDIYTQLIEEAIKLIDNQA